MELPERLGIEDIQKATGGRVVGGGGGGGGRGDGLVKGVSIDTRTIREGELFFALRGPRFDGHRFLGDAAKKGARGAVVEMETEKEIEKEIEGGTGGLPGSFTVIRVEDTLKALGDLAGHLRKMHPVPLVAIGGSTGKTTTKEMAASILALSRKVLKTEGNLNNTVGLPLTLMGLAGDTGAAVVELGISEPGEMVRLVEICRPDVAVMTNIGRGHLETLGTVEGVRRAKAPLFTSLGEGAVKVVNLDDPMVALVSETAGGGTKKITYGKGPQADVRIEEVRAEGSSLNVVYRVRGEKIEVSFSSPLAVNAYNGAAAIGAALPLGASFEEIAEGLSSYRPLKGRMEVVRVGDITVLDDTYNANPESMCAALETLSGMGGRHVAVLGEMLELGAGAVEAHREVGRVAGELGVEVIVAVGVMAETVAEGAGSVKGDRQRSIHCFKDNASALSELKGILSSGDVVLVKASRGAALEEVVKGLKRHRE